MHIIINMLPDSDEAQEAKVTVLTQEECHQFHSGLQETEMCVNVGMVNGRHVSVHHSICINVVVWHGSTCTCM